MRFLRRIWGVIVNPKETLREISNNPSIWEAVGVIVGVSLISVLIVFNKRYLFNVLVSELPPFELNYVLAFIPAFTVFGVFASMILTPIFHFVTTSVYNLLCGFFGYEGKSKGLFATLAFASFPSLFSNIINGILQSLGLNVIAVIFTLAFLAWIITLKIFAIKETYSMSGGKATLIYFIPFIIIISVIGIAIMLFTFSLLPVITRFI